MFRCSFCAFLISSLLYEGGDFVSVPAKIRRGDCHSLLHTRFLRPCRQRVRDLEDLLESWVVVQCRAVGCSQNLRGRSNLRLFKGEGFALILSKNLRDRSPLSQLLRPCSAVYCTFLLKIYFQYCQKQQ